MTLSYPFHVTRLCSVLQSIILVAGLILCQSGAQRRCSLFVDVSQDCQHLAPTMLDFSLMCGVERWEHTAAGVLLLHIWENISHKEETPQPVM